MIRKINKLFFCFLFFLANNTLAKEDVFIKSDNVFLKYSVSGKVALTLKAKNFIQKRNGDREFPHDIHIRIFNNESKKAVITVHANKARMWKDKKLWLFQGDVEVVSIDKDGSERKLNTELLYWNEDNQTIYNKNFIRLETRDTVITGTELHAKQNFSYYKILKPNCTTLVDRN